MKNWATITIAYREKEFIKGALENRLDLGYDTNLVMLSEKPFNGKEYPDDGTKQIAEDMGAMVISGVWTNDDPMLNCGMNVLQKLGIDYVLFLAPDEFITKEDNKKLQEFVESNPDKKAWLCSNMNTYYKTYKHRVNPKETDDDCVSKYEPCIVIKSDCRWVDVRTPVCSWGYLPKDILLYHFSYFRSDYDIKKKIDTFCHAPQILSDWYQTHWLNWTPETKNFHPVVPEQYKEVVVDEPPTEITKYLRYHSLFNPQS